MVLDVVGIELGEGLVLGKGKLEHLGGLLVLGITEGAEVDLAKEFMRLDVIGIMGDLVFGGSDGLPDAPDLEVEVGEAVLEHGRVGVGVQGELVLFDGLGGVVGATGVDRHVFVKMGKAVVVVGGTVIDCRNGRLRWGLGCIAMML